MLYEVITLLRRDETTLIIIDVQRPLRIEADQLVAGRPIFQPHFQITDFKGVNDAVDIPVETGLGCFHRYSCLMGVRHDVV